MYLVVYLIRGQICTTNIWKAVEANHWPRQSGGLNSTPCWACSPPQLQLGWSLEPDCTRSFGVLASPPLPPAASILRRRRPRLSGRAAAIGRCVGMVRPHSPYPSRCFEASGSFVLLPSACNCGLVPWYGPLPVYMSWLARLPVPSDVPYRDLFSRFRRLDCGCYVAPMYEQPH